MYHLRRAFPFLPAPSHNHCLHRDLAELPRAPSAFPGALMPHPHACFSCLSPTCCSHPTSRVALLTAASSGRTATFQSAIWPLSRVSEISRSCSHRGHGLHRLADRYRSGLRERRVADLHLLAAHDTSGNSDDHLLTIRSLHLHLLPGDQPLRYDDEHRCRRGSRWHRRWHRRWRRRWHRRRCRRWHRWRRRWCRRWHRHWHRRWRRRGRWWHHHWLRWSHR